MIRFFGFAFALATLLLSTTVRAELPPLIPRKVLFGNPTKAAPLISPDGKRLAFLAPDKNEVLQVWVQTIGKDDAKQVTADKKRGIRQHLWTYAPDVLLYMQDNDGDENYHLYSVDLKEDVVRDLTPFQGVRAEPIDLNAEHPNEILVGLNIKDRRWHDVYRIDLTTWAVVLDTKNPGDVQSWIADANMQVRCAVAALRDGGLEVRVRAGNKSEWKEIRTWEPDESDCRVLGFNKDGTGLWLLEGFGNDTLRLDLVNLDGSEKPIGGPSGVDMGTVLFTQLNALRWHTPPTATRLHGT